MQLELILGATAIVGAEVGIVLWVDGILRRKIKRILTGRQRGSLITNEVIDVNTTKPQQVVTQSNWLWWKSVLPWPGKKVWAETVLTKVALLGATIEYQAVSAWDWDEAWVIEVDPETVIASSNKIATALAYLEHRGVPET